MTLDNVYTVILSGAVFASVGLATILYRTDIVADTVPFRILKRSKILAGNIAMVTAVLSLILLNVDITAARTVGLKCLMLSLFYAMGIQWCWMVIPLVAPDYLTRNMVKRDAIVFLSSVLLTNIITNVLGFENAFIGILLSVVFVVHCGYWVVKFGKLYRRAMFNLEEEYSDYIFLYIDWTYDASLAVIVFSLSGVLLCYSDKIMIAVFFLFAVLAYCYVVQSLNKYQIHAERLYLGLKKTEEERKSEIARNTRNGFVSVPPVSNDSVADKPQTKSEDVASVYQKQESEDKNIVEEESPIAQRMRKWIEEEGYLQPGLTLNDIADKIGTNRTYVSRFINSTYQNTFFEFIADLRVGKIKKMLMEDPERELEYLSNTCGFSSSSHMSSTFKKITGETLNEFRNKIKRERGE